MDLSTCEFPLTDGDFHVDDIVKKRFDENGFIIVRGLLSSAELGKLSTAVCSDGWIDRHTLKRDDGKGGVINMCLWNNISDDVTGRMASCEKVAGTMEKLLGGEVYHYHTKLMMKNAYTGGQFLWHQDYGYWYHNGCLKPDMGTVFIAIDKCTLENGCLNIIPKSHLCGRIEHKLIKDQLSADPARVDMILEHHQESCPVEMEPGDAIFFHCNVLHRSAPNPSPHRRWAFLVAYNRADNNPVLDHHHPKYTPLMKSSNSAIIDCPSELMNNDGKDPLLQGTDFSLNIKAQEAEDTTNGPIIH